MISSPATAWICKVKALWSSISTGERLGAFQKGSPFDSFSKENHANSNHEQNQKHTKKTSMLHQNFKKIIKPYLFFSFPLLPQKLPTSSFFVSKGETNPSPPHILRFFSHLSFPHRAGRLGTLRQALRAVGGARRVATKAEGRIVHVAAVDLRTAAEIPEVNKKGGRRLLLRSSFYVFLFHGNKCVFIVKWVVLIVHANFRSNRIRICCYEIHVLCQLMST